MSWPLSQDYNEAIQSPATNFADPDLKKGEVVSNALGLPIPFSGNFADVYQVRCPNGSRWAVKCFTREATGLRERYQEISAWLSKAKLPFTVDFSYLDQGIRVHGKWYPILKMQWVEGLTLNQFVAQYLDKPAMLEALLQLWAKMGKYLRAAKVGHCDLQHGNILLVPGSTPNALALKLIDYDGMWIPPLAKTKSGEIGHANYQHPRRLREGTYRLEVDRFPLLLVATAMRALKADKSLWAKYDNGDNLLFKESDLAAPGQSPLFEELASLPDPGLVMLAAQVRAALKGPLESTVLLEDAMPETKTSVVSTRPSKLVTGTPASAGVSKSSVRAAPDALAFDVAGDAATASFIRKRDLAKGKQAGGIGRIPVAVWAGVAAAVVLFGALGGVGLWAMTRKAPPTEPHVALQIDPPPVVVEPKEPPPKIIEPVVSAPVVNPPVVPVVPVVTPPVAVKPPNEEPANKPGARVVRTYAWRYTGGVRSVSFSQDGNTALALGADGVLTQFDPQTGASPRSASDLGYVPKCAVLTPDGLRAVIAGGDSKVHVRDLAEGKDVEPQSGEAGGPINWVDVAPDGKLAILGGEDGFITLWDLVRGAAKNRWKGSEASISLVRFSLDGKTAVSCGRDEIAHFWNVADGIETLKIQNYLPNHPAQPLTAAFLPDNKVFVGFNAAARGVWDLKAGRMTNGGSGGGSEANRTVAASPDGALTALSTEGRPGFTLFGQKKPGVWIGQTPPVAPDCLAFAPDSRHLLVGCIDGTLHYVAVTLPGEEAAPVVMAPDPPSSAASLAAGWDKVDPDGDCKLVVENNSLTIDAPAKHHDLTVENGVMNAPRLVHEVAGDFTAQVRVAGDFNPVGPATTPGFLPVTAAGFLLMVDDRTYFRCERAAAVSPNPDQSSFLVLEWRVNGKKRPLGGPPLIPADKPIFLRVQRKGNQIAAAFSQDGRQWRALPSLGIALPPTLKMALSAVTTSAAPFQPHFDGFQLTTNETNVAVKPALPEKELRKPPTPDNIAKAIGAIKEEYKEDYAKLNTPKDRSELASKLRTAAFAAKDKPDLQYALYVEARDLAARGEDLAGSQKIISEMGEIFAIDAKEAKEAALLAAGATFSGKAAAAAYLAEVKPLLQEARTDDDYEKISPFLPAVRKAADVARDPDAAKNVAMLEKLQKDFEAVKKDLQTLKEKPDDLEANLAVGKFYCFQKQDWDKGDPYLAKSGNMALASAATKDADAPEEAKEQVALADAWYKIAENITLGVRTGAQRRAFDWYSKALPNLNDKDEERIKARVMELTKQFPDVLAAWESLDISKAEAVGNAYLRLKPNQTLSTKLPVDGPIEIVLMARTAKTPPTFEFLLAKEPFLAWQVNLTGVIGRRINKSRFGMGSFGGNNFQFTPNEWITYTCKLEDARLMGLMNGRNYFIDSNKNDLSKPRTVQLKAVDQTLEIKSFTVKPIEKP